MQNQLLLDVLENSLSDEKILENTFDIVVF